MPNSNSHNSPLLKRGYGYDVSGEVSDDKQINMHDLRLLQTQPHPQQYTEQPREQTMSPDAKLYHGTTLYNWERELTKLLVTPNLERAEAAATKASVSNLSKYGPKREDTAPIVLMIKFGDLNKNDLGQADSEVHESGSWQESLHNSDGFSIQGDLKMIKTKFKVVKF